MELLLNIYGKKNGKKAIIKTYKAIDYKVSFGVLEDLMNIMQGVSENSNENEMMKHIVTLMGDIKPLMMDVFDGLTEKELRNADMQEVMKVAMILLTYGLQGLTSLGGDNKKK